MSLERLADEPYASIICYPRSSRQEIRKRLKELRSLYITSVEFIGDTQVFGVSVLGKGYVGVVIQAWINEERVALKIRRVDADRSGMRREAKMLQIANLANVGPRFLKATKNFLTMQLVDGRSLQDWLSSEENGTHSVQALVRDILEQCWRLDRVGLDHGELSHAPKHIVVDGEEKPWILDFETASTARRTSNVTSICHFLFFADEIAGEIAGLRGHIDRNSMVDALKDYKNDKTRSNFDKILKIVGF